MTSNKQRRLVYRRGDLQWTKRDIGDTKTEAELKAPYTRLPPAKPPKTLTAKPRRTP